MAKNHFIRQNRRQFIQTSIAAAAALTMAPYLVQSENVVLPAVPAKRHFGKIDFMVTTLGLGGQASIQWTPAGIDPVAIILKAYKLGINYYDTSNYYGPSQLNYGKAFRQLGLVPGQPDYSEIKRKAIFVTSKTGLRFGKGGMTVRRFTEVLTVRRAQKPSMMCVAPSHRFLEIIMAITPKGLTWIWC